MLLLIEEFCDPIEGTTYCFLESKKILDLLRLQLKQSFWLRLRYHILTLITNSSAILWVSVCAPICFPIVCRFITKYSNCSALPIILDFFNSCGTKLRIWKKAISKVGRSNALGSKANQHFYENVQLFSKYFSLCCKQPRHPQFEVYVLKCWRLEPQFCILLRGVLKNSRWIPDDACLFILLCISAKILNAKCIFNLVIFTLLLWKL